MHDFHLVYAQEFLSGVHCNALLDFKRATGVSEGRAFDGRQRTASTWSDSVTSKESLTRRSLSSHGIRGTHGYRTINSTTVVALKFLGQVSMLLSPPILMLVPSSRQILTLKPTTSCFRRFLELSRATGVKSKIGYPYAAGTPPMQVAVLTNHTRRASAPPRCMFEKDFFR